MSKKKFFYVSVKEKGKQIEEVPIKRFFFAPRYLTIGNSVGSHIFTSIKGLRRRILEKGMIWHKLLIPVGMDGDITIGGTTVSICWLTNNGLLKKSGNYYKFPLPKKNACTLKIGDLTLTFDHKEVDLIEKKPAKPDSSLKRPWVSREDSYFYYLLIFFVAFHFSSVHYLDNFKIKKANPIEALRNISPRFAKLILKSEKKKVLKKKEIIPPMPEKSETKEEEPKQEEERKEEPEKVEPKEEPKTEERQKESPPQAKEASSPEVSNRPEVSPRREMIREKVRSRGLLGVIMARTKPAAEVLTENVFSDIDNLVMDIDKAPPVKEVKIKETFLSRYNPEKKREVKTITKEMIKGLVKKSEPIDITQLTKDKVEIVPEEEQIEEKEWQGPGNKRDEAEVYKTVVKYIGGLKYIYNNALKKNARLKGNLTVEIVISANGKINNVKLVSSTLEAPKLERRMIKRIYRWKFRKLTGGNELKIKYTFDFSPVG